MKPKRFIQLLAAILIGLVASIALIEVALHIWTPSSLQFKAVRQADPIVHHSLIPSSHYEHRSPEFDVEVRTNSIGFRDREHANDSANSYRILVLGDSFVEGHGVPMESCFVHKLELRLNAIPERTRPIDVYNFGVSGYSPIIEYLVLKQTGLGLKPNLVILFYDMSDVQEDVLYADDAEFDSTGLPTKIHPSWPSFGNVTLVPRSSLKTFLHEKSYLYSLLAQATNHLKPKPLYDEGNIFAGRFMHMVDSTTDRWEKYFGQSQSYVKAIADLCTSNNIQFVLATFPRGNQVNSLEWAIGRKVWGLDSLVHNSAIFPSLQSFVENNGVTFLNMTPAYRARSKGDLYYSYDGHWTSGGHTVAADTLFDFLKTKHLVPN